MIRKEYAEILVVIYARCRKSPVWDEFKKLHDEEDRAYWAELDLLKVKTKGGIVVGHKLFMGK